MKSLQKKLIKTIVSEGKPICGYYCKDGEFCVLGMLAIKADVPKEKLTSIENGAIDEPRWIWLRNRLGETFGLDDDQLAELQEINDAVPNGFSGPDPDGIDKRRTKLLEYIEKLPVS